MEFLNRLFNLSSNGDDAPVDIHEQHESEKKLLKFVIAVCVIIIGMLLLSNHNISKEKHMSVELPPQLYATGELKVGNGFANDFYFEVWAEWLVRSTSTFTAGDIHEKLNKALRFFEEEKLDKYTGIFGNLNNTVLRGNIKQTFLYKKPIARYFQDTEFQDETTDISEIRSAVIEFPGVASQIIKGKIQPDKECKYVVSIKLEGTHLFGSTYDTNCFK